MGITSVYVTHDQAEAMVISDRIAVMNSGNVVQIGTAHEIYEKPANRFVADFIGAMNFMAGEVVQVIPDTDTVYVRTEFCEKLVCTANSIAETPHGKEVYAYIRPEDVEVFAEPSYTGFDFSKGSFVHQASLGHFLHFSQMVEGTQIR